MKRFLPVLPILFFCLPFNQTIQAQCDTDVNAGDDIYLCAPPTPTQLNGSIGGEYLSFMWTPTTGMTGSNSLSPTVNVTQTTSYVLSVSSADLGNNLVSNGDFEGGNSSFTSDYGFSPGDLVPEGLYDVIDNPQDDHAGFAPCDDHTSGTGNMMVVNGAGTPNQNVWCQTVTVTPNSQYVLSAWVTSVVASSPAMLQFNINGSSLGPIFNAPGSLCNWQNYFQIWNSGSNTSATICIVNQNTTLGGNDFALDDIVFAPVCVERDTVKVIVVSVTAVAAPTVVTIPCEGALVTLNGAGSSVGPGVTYQWDTPDGNIVSGGTTLNPVVDQPGSYTLTVAYIAEDGTVCEKTATVNVVLSPNPLVAWINPPAPLGCGASTVSLVGNTNQLGFAVYAWETQDGHIVSGADMKICVVDMVGTYSLTVTNSNTGCTAVSEVTVTSTTNPPLAFAAVSDTVTCFQDTVQLLSTGSSSGPGITYAWLTSNGHLVSGQNSATALADAPGVYILNVTNTTNNCTSSDTVTVLGNLTPPYMFLPPQQQITCTVDTITMIVYLYPPPFVLINWTATNGGHIVSGQYTPNPQIDSAGNYHVVIQDPINGCTTTGSVYVSNNINYPVAAIDQPGQITCQAPSLTLSGSGSSTGSNFGYTWQATNGGNIVSGGNTLAPLVNSAGDYSLTVLDSTNGCFSVASTAVTADTNVVQVVANAPDILTCVLDTVSLNANGSSTGPGITFAWTTTDGNIVSGADTPNPAVDQPGTYQLLVTNTANGCAGADLAVVLNDVAPPAVSISQPADLTCTNPTQVLMAQNNSPAGSFTYEWTASNGGNILQDPFSLTPTINAPGTYTLLVTNTQNGCTATFSTVVNVATGTPVATTAVAGPITCAQPVQMVDGAGSSTGTTYTYQWTAFNGGHIQGSSTGITANVDEPGMYVLAVTNTSNGCITSDTILVNENITLPQADAGLPDTITCSQPTATLLANGPIPPAGYTFDWGTSGGTLSGPANQAQATATSAGLYFVTVTDSGNGCASIDTVQILADQQPPTLAISTPMQFTCLLTTQNLQAQNQSLPGNFSYQWTHTGGNIVLGGNTLSPEVDAPGVYTVTATNLANGCFSTQSVAVAQDTTAPDVQIALPGEITCNNPMQTISAQNLATAGMFSYQWTASNGGNIVMGATTLTPAVDLGGTYTLLTTNQANGCTATEFVQVVQNNTPPTADAGTDATLTCNLNSLSLSGVAAGGTNLTFGWTGGSIVSGSGTATPVVDAPGLYTLTVTNQNNGCTATDVVEILNDANAPNVNAGVGATLTCAVTQTTLNATASVGPNFIYSWQAINGGLISADPNTLTPTVAAAGVYVLVVTNTNNGCTRSSSVTVLEDVMPPTVDAGATATLTCAITSLSLNGSNTGGGATYLWQTTNGNIVSGNTSVAPVVDATGVYTFTATLTSNGCSASDQVQVTIDTLAPALAIQAPELLTCNQLTATLNAVVQQPGAGNFTAQWTTVNGHFTGAQTTLSTAVDEPGDYLLTIENTQNGCVSTQTVSVGQDIAAPTVLVAPGGDITCAQPSLVLSGAGSSAGNNFSYSWTAANGGSIVSGGNTLNPTVGSAGTYTLQVNNSSNGCTATLSTTVGNNTTPPTVAIAQPGELTCVQTSVTLNGGGSSAGANFVPSWATSGGHIVAGQNTLSPMVDEPGNYVLTIQNTQNGCTQSAQVLVVQNTAAPGAEAGIGSELHCNNPQAMLSGSSPAAGVMQFAWSTTDGHLLSSNTATGVADEPGAYTLTVTNPQTGCTSTDVVMVSAIALPEFAPELEQPDCHIRTGAVVFGGVTGGKAPFVYSTDGGETFSGQTTVDDLSPGTYSLVVQDAYGCTAAETAVIDPPFIPTLMIPAVTTLEVGDSIRLDPETNIALGSVLSWEWSPAAGLSCTDCRNPWAKPFQSTNYQLVVTDENNCSATAPVQVRVDRRRNIYAPNVFSPNGDGQNDYFMIFGKGVKEIQSLRIFDRWGTELWLGEGLTIGDEPSGWDGAYRGSAMNPAVFVWWAKIEFIDGVVELFYGDVTLVR